MLKMSENLSAIYQRFLIILVAFLTFTLCILPMSKLPMWNGEEPGHRNQYELMAEAILDGRLHLVYGDEWELELLKNPYDPAEREESGVTFHWDHAYYNGHYYMYFGVVPVFLTFLPYRIVTGEALTTYHATQIFTVVIVIGIFVLFRMLSKLFFQKLDLLPYLSLSAAFSVMSVWYAAARPALYCTAITAGIALELWSIYFFVRAVYYDGTENRKILFAAVGALLGALVFGCRPTIGLANIVVLPLLFVFLRERKIKAKLIGKLALAASPYLVVAVCLMMYNYVRFGDPMEFGQAYQLTVTDQSSYSMSIGLYQIFRIVNDTITNFFAYSGMDSVFPYLRASSVFMNFPVLMLSVFIIHPLVYKKFLQTKTSYFLIGLVVAVLLITAADILWSPYLTERYRMDTYFLLAIVCFMILGFLYDGTSHKRIMNVIIVSFSALTVLSSLLLCMERIYGDYPDTVIRVSELFSIF